MGCKSSSVGLSEPGKYMFKAFLTPVFPTTSPGYCSVKKACASPSPLLIIVYGLSMSILAFCPMSASLLLMLSTLIFAADFFR